MNFLSSIKPSENFKTGDKILELKILLTNGKELWVVLLEKAWAKLNVNYAKTIWGEPQDVFDVITNAYSEKIRITNNK